MTSNMANDFPSNWLPLLDTNASAQLDRAIAAAEREIALGKNIFPARADWFAALRHTAPENVRAVILGQDPYPTAGNAMGLAFSVPRGVKVPASLKNIYKAMQNDLNISPVVHGDLSTWASQGVLLLNATLTVEESKPNAHAEFGWRQVTDALISAIGARSEKPKSFLLWGGFAQKKAPLIDASRHLILNAPHPSPLSARRGFFDCKHFSQTNAFLVTQGQTGIDWQLPVAV
jgi:uracil-DNA glycosylase